MPLGPYAVQRGLIRGASQQRVLTLRLGVQGAALVWVPAFGYAFSWVFATIGLVTGNPEAAQFAAPFPGDLGGGQAGEEVQPGGVALPARVPGDRGRAGPARCRRRRARGHAGRRRWPG